MNTSRNILIIYHHPRTKMLPHIYNHLHVLELSQNCNQITYYNTRDDDAFFSEKDMQGPQWLCDSFDVVIFHNTFLARRSEPGKRFYHWKRNCRWMRDLSGVKLALPQDEYNYAELLDEWLYELGVSVIFSCFDAETYESLYPIMCHHARFYKAFPEYIDANAAEAIAPRLKSLEKRPFDIVYRVPPHPYRFGRTRQTRLGEIVHARAKALGLRCDISTQPKDIVLGDGWLDFVASGRATLGSEGGASAIEWRGEVQARIDTLLKNNPRWTFEQIQTQMPLGWDNHRLPVMRSSHFDAIITKTCQVLVEGHYNNILKADRHYIPLKQDYSNVDEAIIKLQDISYIEAMTECSYQEIYLEGSYTYQDFAIQLEQAITEALADPPTPGLSADHLRPYTLMLVPHEPDRDSRVRWAIDLCRQEGRVHVIGSVIKLNKNPLKTHDGVVFIDRCILSKVNLTTIWKLLWATLDRLPSWMLLFLRHPISMVQRSRLANLLLHRLFYIFGIEEDWGPKIDRWHLQAPGLPAPKSFSKFISRTYPRKGVVEGDFLCITQTILECADAVSFAPRFILCHDVYGLEPAVALKNQYGCPILYDTHEYWPEVYHHASKSTRLYIKAKESALIQHADVVVAVTPQIARELENIYSINEVLIAPNAEPFTPPHTPAHTRSVNVPLRFLLHGGAAPGRGIDLLLAAWRQVDNPDVILVIRCPENPYLVELRKQFRDLTKAGRVEFVSSVPEAELIEAASRADIGVIPYPGPSLNHIYACPNKLSQYMQAGLAILHHANMEFVGNVVKQYNCGLSYNPAQPETLRGAIDTLAKDQGNIQQLQRNAYRAAETEFNWETQSRAYRQAIKDLFHRG